MTDCVQEAVTLEATGRSQRAMEVVFTPLHALLGDQAFTACDALLRELLVCGPNLSPLLLIGALRTAGPVRGCLSQWGPLLDYVERRIGAGHKYLKGLR